MVKGQHTKEGIINMKRRVYIDCFSITDGAKGYDEIKAAALAAGMFSCFEASETQKSADIFTRLCRDPEVETFPMLYPWTGIRKRA